MKKRSSLMWAMIIVALLAQLTFSVTYVADVAQTEEALCVRNSSNGCDNNGCEGTGGVCGRAIVEVQALTGDSASAAASPCWCLY